MTGAELIAKERQEQIEKHQRSIQNDILLYKKGELIEAAVALIVTDDYLEEEMEILAPEGWHYNTWMKMIKKPYNQRLIIAGALVAAELDRLQNI